MKHILVADDEPDIIDILNFRLTKWGYQMTSAADGRQAMIKIRELKPDLVLLDFRMPLMTGGEVSLAVKNDPSLQHIPVIIMTASSEKAGEIDAHEFKADASIIKPFEAAEVLGKIKSLLKEI